MFKDLLSNYNPKDSSSHTILRYFSEKIDDELCINFIKEMFSNGFWMLPTEISKVSDSKIISQTTSELFYQKFDDWVTDRIVYSTSISIQMRNPYITEDLNFAFRSALLCIRNLGFPIKSLLLLKKMTTDCNLAYLEKFYSVSFWVIIEEYEPKDIEIFANYFIKEYLKTKNENIIVLIFHLSSNLAFSHKIYYLSDDLINNLTEFHDDLLNLKSKNNWLILNTILLLDLIINRKLDLRDSKYNQLIIESLDKQAMGNFDNLTFLTFLKKFNYNFDKYDFKSNIEALFNKLDEIQSITSQKSTLDKQKIFHHLVNSANEYFELLLFYQESFNEKEVKMNYVRFIKLIDEIRDSFKDLFWYDEYLNIKPVKGIITNAIKSGFEVQINDGLFKSNFNQMLSHQNYRNDTTAKLRSGFLHFSTLIGFPKIKALFNSYQIQLNSLKVDKIAIRIEDMDKFELIENFYIAKLVYSNSNKKSVLKLVPFNDKIADIVRKFEIKAFFHSLEIFLIDCAFSFLKLPSPFKKDVFVSRIIPLPNYLFKYEINTTQSLFWDLLKEARPNLYQKIYLDYISNQTAIKKIINAHLKDIEVKGYIKSKSKGGMIVEVFGIEAFLPGSHIDVKQVSNYDDFVGRTYNFKIIKINSEFNNFVVSRKVLFIKEFEKAKNEFLDNLTRGQIIVGKVKNVLSYGVFVEFEWFDGLIHKSDLAWDLVHDPNDYVKINERIKVVVLDFDSEKKRIYLGRKQLYENPFKNLLSKYKVGDIISGVILELTNYGIFVELEEGLQGLIHSSEIAWDWKSKYFLNKYNIGDTILVKILSLSTENQKISLSIKQINLNPWIEKAQKYTTGKTYIARIKQIHAFGIYLELEEGLGTIIHKSDIVIDYKFINLGSQLEVILETIDFNGQSIKVKFLN